MWPGRLDLIRELPRDPPHERGVRIPHAYLPQPLNPRVDLPSQLGVERLSRRIVLRVNVTSRHRSTEQEVVPLRVDGADRWHEDVVLDERWDVGNLLLKEAPKRPRE